MTPESANYIIPEGDYMTVLNVFTATVDNDLGIIIQICILNPDKPKDQDVQTFVTICKGAHQFAKLVFWPPTCVRQVGTARS